jgi:hypothetical protein
MKEYLKALLKFVVLSIVISPFFIIVFGPALVGYYFAIPDYFWVAAVASLVWVFPAMYIVEKISKYLDRAAWYLLEKIEEL